MTIEVQITNKHAVENPEKTVVIRRYTNKGNSVDDGTILAAGESISVHLHDGLFLQVDECANPDYVKDVPAPVAPPEPPTTDADDDDPRSESEKLSYEEAATSRAERGVTVDEDAAFLAQEASEDATASLEDKAAEDADDEAQADVNEDIDALLS